MKKKPLILIGVIVFVVVLAGFLLLRSYEAQSPSRDTSIDLTGVDFSKIGYVTKTVGGSIMSGATFIYDEPGKPATTVALMFDQNSICTLDEQSVPCSLLSISANAALQERPVFVEGIWNENKTSVRVRNIAVDHDAEHIFGYIRSVTPNNANYLVAIDQVDFLSGDEALTAAVEDTGCPPETIGDCVPSMYNNFYIRNRSEELATYILPPQSTIQIFAHAGAPDLEEVSLEIFAQRFADKKEVMEMYPFKIFLDGAIITQLEEQYLP